MSWTVLYLILSTPSLSVPGLVTTASGQGQMIIAIKELQGDDGQCPSVEARKRARNEIREIVISSFCRGPEWRRIAFIDMTDTNYDCPTGLNLTTYSKRTCGPSHIGEGYSSTTFNVGGSPYNRVCGRIRGYQFAATGAFGHDLRNIDSYYVDGVSHSWSKW